MDGIDVSAPPPAAFVPRPEQAAILASALAAVRQTEGERRWNLALGRMSGWIVAGLMVIPLGYSLSILRNRPVPQDRIWVAMMHVDGSTAPAKPVEDMTITEREAAASQFVFDYIDYRVSYSWETIQRNYDRTRFVTYGEAQRDYAEDMTNGPSRPTETLGQRGERKVSVVSVERIGPNAFEAVYTARVKDKAGIVLPEMRRRVRVATAVFPGLPPEIARRFDPLKMVVTGWDDRPAAFDPTATGGAR